MTYDPHDQRNLKGKDWIPFTLLAAVMIAAVAAIFGIHLGWIPAINRSEGFLKTIGWSAVGLGAVIGGLNFYLSFLRYPIYRLRGGQKKSYQFVSGVPGIGSLALFVGALLVPPSLPALVLLCGIALIDTGGLPWFFLALGVDAKKQRCTRRRDLDGEPPGCR
ncbi:MAG: hypothetical protein AAGI48_09840 [Verrucomicrobiota bacterium]